MSARRTGRCGRRALIPRPSRTSWRWHGTRSTWPTWPAVAQAERPRSTKPRTAAHRGKACCLTTNNQNVATGWSGSGGDRGWTYGENAMGFAVSPTDPNRLVITDFGFAHVSTNGGTTWTQMYVNPADQNPAGANTPKGKTYRSSGLDNTTSWGITWVTPTKLIGSNSDIQGVRSDDGGQSWSFNYTGHTDNSMYRSVVHPQTGVVYAGTSSVHDIYQSTRLADSTLDPGTGKVLFSTNQGSTWQTMHDFGDPGRLGRARSEQS